MKRFALAFVAALLTLPVHAQEMRKAQLFAAFDVDSGTMTYGYFAGQNGNPFSGAGIQGDSSIETSGSSTTVTAVTAGTNPFALLSVGDAIQVRLSPTSSVTRYITAKASADEVTIDTATDLSAGYLFTWYKRFNGTAATSGWVDVSTLTDVTITVQYEQGDLDALLARWECKVNNWDTQPVYVYPGEDDKCGQGGTLAAPNCSFATAGATTRLSVVVGGQWDACRLGVAFGSTDASDAGANLEQVSGYLTGRLRR